MRVLSRLSSLVQGVFNSLNLSLNEPIGLWVSWAGRHVLKTPLFVELLVALTVIMWTIVSNYDFGYPLFWQQRL